MGAAGPPGAERAAPGAVAAGGQGGAAAAGPGAARGSAPGLYTLTSFNSGPIDDVAIDWAAKIVVVMPR